MQGLFRWNPVAGESDFANNSLLCCWRFVRTAEWRARRFGGEHAGKKIERRGSSGAIEEGEGLEPGEWEIAPGISVQGLCGGVWKHDARGAGGGVHEPSPGVVQRVEQSGDRFEHAQREGDQRLRFYLGGED